MPSLCSATTCPNDHPLNPIEVQNQGKSAEKLWRNTWVMKCQHNELPWVSPYCTTALSNLKSINCMFDRTQRIWLAAAWNPANYSIILNSFKQATLNLIHSYVLYSIQGCSIINSCYGGNRQRKSCLRYSYLCTLPF